MPATPWADLWATHGVARRSASTGLSSLFARGLPKLCKPVFHTGALPLRGMQCGWPKSLAAPTALIYEKASRKRWSGRRDRGSCRTTTNSTAKASPFYGIVQACVQIASQNDALTVLLYLAQPHRRKGSPITCGRPSNLFDVAAIYHPTAFSFHCPFLPVKNSGNQKFPPVFSDKRCFV